MCVCVRERERERERVKQRQADMHTQMSVHVRVCCIFLSNTHTHTHIHTHTHTHIIHSLSFSHTHALAHTLHVCIECIHSMYSMLVWVTGKFHFEGDHTLGVGTKTYAAPEQMKGTAYDSKVSAFIIDYDLTQIISRVPDQDGVFQA